MWTHILHVGDTRTTGIIIGKLDIIAKGKCLPVHFSPNVCACDYCWNKKSGLGLTNSHSWLVAYAKDNGLKSS